MSLMSSELDDPGQLFVQPRPWADMDAWHEQVAELRQARGIIRVELPGYTRFDVLTRHADVFAVSRDNDTWANTPNVVLGADADWQRVTESGMPLPSSLVQLDGADHRGHRQVANDWFKPAAVGRRQARIDQLADQFIQKMRDLGDRCDFAREIAAPYTLRVIMDIYGVPEADEALMLELTQGIFGAADPEYLGDAATSEERAMNSIFAFIEYFDELTADRRAHPRDDLASVIANGQVNGSHMDDNHRLWYFIIVATAGHDTTSFALSGGMEAFARDPAQLWAIRDEPDLVANAAEEVIRWTSPVRHFLRYATRDTEIAGHHFHPGDRVLLSYPAANRDEAVFVDPMRFDVRRSDADKLLAFGVGAHFCLGSQFARREIRTMIAKLAAQLEGVELDGEVEYAQSHFVSGAKHVPLGYTFR
jgi:cytochrome P450